METNSMKLEQDSHQILNTKKLLKQVFFGICDFMILNSYFACNVSTTDISQWRMVKKQQFHATVVQKLLEYQVTQAELQHEAMHLLSICPSSVTRSQCAICALEIQMLIKTGGSDVFGKLFRSQKHISQCSHHECRMLANNLSIDNDRKIINVPRMK